MSPRPIPPCVLQLWPDVPAQTWQWMSTTRLRAPHAQVPDVVWLVVLDTDHTHAQGRPMPATAPERLIRETYAHLRNLLNRHATRETNCHDGTPETRDDGRCTWCGNHPDEHTDGGEPR